MTLVSGCCTSVPQLGRLLLLRDHRITSHYLEVTKLRTRLRLSIRFLRRTTLLRSVKVYRASTPNVRYVKGTPCVYRKCVKTRVLHTRNFPHRTEIYRHRAKANLSLGRVRQRNVPVPLRSCLPRALRRRLIYCTSGFCSGSRPRERGATRRILSNLTHFKTRKIRQFEH